EGGGSGRAAAQLEGMAGRGGALAREGRDASLVPDDRQLHGGIRIQRGAPRPGRFHTPQSPPWALAIPRAMDKPSPVRPVGDDPVRNASKTSCSSPGGRPPPLSATSNDQPTCPLRTQSRTGPPPRACPAASC